MKAIIITFRLVRFVFLFAAIWGSLQTTKSQDIQIRTDTITSISLDGVVVTANRFENRIISSGASVSATRAREIEKLPVVDFSNTLKYLPGVYSSSTDGLGLVPQVNIRGFYGGGESEYMTVMVDGLPLNDPENGLASWNMMPLLNMNSVEILRGGSSALYGDVAIGGVLNLISDKADQSFTSAFIGFGTFKSYNLGINHGGKFGKGSYELYASDQGTAGFRENSQWRSTTFGGKLKFALGRNGTLSIRSVNQLLKYDTPGPLDTISLADDRASSSPYYREDGKEYAKYMVSAGYRQKLNKKTDLDATLTYQRKNSDETRTYVEPALILDPFTYQPVGIYDTTLYGNSMKRDINTNQANLALRIFHQDTEAGAKITGGIEADYGNLDNQVNEIFRGFQNDYQNEYVAENKPEFDSEGFRFKTALYASGEIRIFDEMKLLAGLRYDYISDAINSNIPMADTSMDKTYRAFSPKISLNLSTGETEKYKGSIFGGYSGGFKAPTVDQRTDLKSLSYVVFFPAGPTYQMAIIDGIPFSNADLKPQYSKNYELGTHQYFRFSEKFAGEISLIGYIIDVEDEIDFDLSQMKYTNLLNTRHAGLEVFINLKYRENWGGFINFNSTQVKLTSGENEGNYVKGVPRLSQSIGVSYAPETGFGASLVHHGASGIRLDDENTQTLDPYGVFSARLEYRYDWLTIFLDIENIFDNGYISTGYMVYGVKQLYPAAGRFLRGGLQVKI